MVILSRPNQAVPLFLEEIKQCEKDKMVHVESDLFADKMYKVRNSDSIVKIFDKCPDLE